MIAVIKTGGKQYKVSPGDRLRIERLATKAGESVEFRDVLLVSDEQGKAMKFGTPVIDGTVVTAKVVAVGRAQKVLVGKFKHKIRYYRRRGHRQSFTEVEIQNIA